MADNIWRLLTKRGVNRDDPSTWPRGFVGKMQPLRQRRVFDAFGTDAVWELVERHIGPDGWGAKRSWGPALVTFPEPGPWQVAAGSWHFDLPARGQHDEPPAARLFGFVSDVEPLGGGTLIVEGSHELIRRMMAASRTGNAGSSADVRKRLIARSPWFRALCGQGGERLAQFMVDGDEVDGVYVRVAELTGSAGDVVAMPAWTMHTLSMNCRTVPRLMVTHTVYARTFVWHGDESGDPH